MESPLVENASSALVSTTTSVTPGVTSPLEFLPGVSPHDVVSVVFTITFFIWLFYMVISIYHWLRYGSRSWLLLPALLIHVVVSAAILLYASSGFQ